MQNINKKDHWDDHAKQWNRLASPLRPCSEDLQLIRQALGPDAGLCLMLGVTPEFCSLSTHLVAIDHNETMIRTVWPGNHNGRFALQGDWLHLPFRTGVFDAVSGDGCLTLLSYPLSYELLCRELKRVLKPKGKAVFRAFTAPEDNESCADVRRAALEGRINGFHAFKWRMAMAMTAESGQPNVSVAAIYETFNRMVPDRERIAAWDLQDIATIEAYRGSSATYSFPKLSELRRIFNHGFKETGLMHGSYELSELCPILVLESCK